MMKSLLLIFSFFFILFFATGCGVKQMNENMERSNESVTKNTETVQHSSDVIQKNTEEVSRSTTTMRTFGAYFPIILVIILVVLIYPSLVLIKLQRKIVHDMKVLMDKLKKE